MIQLVETHCTCGLHSVTWTVAPATVFTAKLILRLIFTWHQQQKSTAELDTEHFQHIQVHEFRENSAGKHFVTCAAPHVFCRNTVSFFAELLLLTALKSHCW